MGCNDMNTCDNTSSNHDYYSIIYTYTTCTEHTLRLNLSQGSSASYCLLFFFYQLTLVVPFQMKLLVYVFNNDQQKFCHITSLHFCSSLPICYSFCDFHGRDMSLRYPYFLKFHAISFMVKWTRPLEYRTEINATVYLHSQFEKIFKTYNP